LKTKLSYVYSYLETSQNSVSNNDPLGDDPWGYDGYGNSSMNYFRDKRRPEAQQSRPVRMFGTRADMMSFTGVGSGDFWADGIGFDDWNGSFGSNSYRDAINARFNSWGRDFFTYDDEGERVDIVEKNGKLYKKCEACGEYAGSSEDGTKKYYYNTYELVQQSGGVTIYSERFLTGDNATISRFSAVSPQSVRRINGYFLEPGGPSTTKSGQDKMIPAGTYTVEPYSGTDHPNTWIIYNDQVSKSRAILIHTGNLPCHTAGCQLPGTDYGFGNMVNTVDGQIVTDFYVTGSGNAYNQLNGFLNTYGGNGIKLIITDVNPGL